MDNDDAMKNERCLIKKINEINAKIIKTCICFIGLIFLMGFYDERNIYVNLEEMTIELGDVFPNDKYYYINNLLVNSQFVLEDNVPKNENGEANKLGTYNYYIVYRDEERMYSRLTNKKATVSVIDTIKPEIKLKETSLKFEYGSKVDVSDIAICYDLSLCKLSVKERINTKKVGVQEIVIVAVDEGNNITEEKVNITIKEKPVVRYYYASYPEIDQYNNSLNSGLSNEELIARRNILVEYAKQFEGNPYVYGGTSLTNGADCSGFILSVYAYLGYRLPRNAGGQGLVGIPVNRSELLPGDLIVYYFDNGGGHIGMYIGNGLMIHAGTEQTGIVIVPIFSGNKSYRRIIY